jgi:F-type H+-transporting ATPase subunit delta
MRAASRDALAKLRGQQDSVSGQGQSVDALVALAEDLYSVTQLLVSQPQLRRTLADPATAPEGRAVLVAQLLQGKIGAGALTTTQDAVRERWSSPWDLADALELTAIDTLFVAAERQGALGDVEDELFRFERILDAETGLTTLLDEPTVEASRRVSLLDTVLASKVHPITKLLLEHAVASQRTRGITYAAHDLLDEAAARRERSVARVLSAVALTDEQQTRLATALAQTYGRPISVRTAVDPSVQGGLVVRIGDEVIDGSVAARLANVRTALAG